MVIEDRPLTYEEERGKPTPSFNHSFIQMNLGSEFVRDTRYRVHSELTLDLGKKPDLTPDLCVFKRGPVNLIQDQIRVSEPPLLIVEILSPSQGSFEVLQRFQRYFAHGVKTCWLVEPHIHTVTIFGADDSEIILHEGVAKDPATGLKADLAQVFS